MNRLSLTLGVVALACASMPAFAASPWDGTWKLNEAKSHLTGTTFSIEKTGSMYEYKGGAVAFKFACDGKDYPVLANRTMSCTGGGADITSVAKAGGKVLATTHRTVSTDGKMLMEESTGTHPDGSSFDDKDTYTRTAGSGATLVGTWRNVKSTQSAPDVMVLKLNGDVMHSEDPARKTIIDARLDGTPAPLVGPEAPPGIMLSNKPDGKDKLVSVVTLNGKEMGKDIMTLSADGKTITDVSWNPGKESEKQTYVYDKQ